MVTDPVEIQIISNARQKNLRDPKRSRAHFERIFGDFLSEIDFEGKKLFDLGPGQFDFGVLARDLGAETYGIDDDPAIVSLGEHKGFPTRLGKIQQIRANDFPISFDGLFCKFSINAFWFYDDLHSLAGHIHQLVKLLKPEGWAWIAPWNGAPKNANLRPAEKNEILDRQAEVFHEHGFKCFDISKRDARHYGVSGLVENHALFLRATHIPKHILDAEMPLSKK